MIWSWFKKRRRRKITGEPFPLAWSDLVARNVEHWALLPTPERQRLEEIVQVLVAEKHWEGCGGLTMTDEVKVTVSAQAGLLLLGLDHDYYRNVLSVLVYPAGYVLPRTHMDDEGLVQRDERVPVLGTAHLRGPVVLSWRSAREGGRDGRDGRNLVYHEFAHKLDMLDGLVDGTPPLGDRQLEQWVAVMTEAYQRLRKRTREGRPTLLDPYGATDVAEFFACATELFFEKPIQLQDRHPKLYGVLKDFYGQDTAERLREQPARRRS
jgi:Mlc titration factor MtfA (ptsG expression regulator)